MQQTRALKVSDSVIRQLINSSAGGFNFSLWQITTLAAIAAIPLAWSIPLPFFPKRDLNLTAFDILIALAFILWLIDIILKIRDFFNQCSIKIILNDDNSPSLNDVIGRSKPAFLLLLFAPELRIIARVLFLVLPLFLLGLLSFSFSEAGFSTALWVKTIIQWIEYLVLTPLLLSFLLVEKKWLTPAALALAVGCLVSVFSAFWQLDNIPADICGAAGNRHAFLLGIALALPLCVSLLNFVTKKSESDFTDSDIDVTSHNPEQASEYETTQEKKLFKLRNISLEVITLSICCLVFLLTIYVSTQLGLLLALILGFVTALVTGIKKLSSWNTLLALTTIVLMLATIYIRADSTWRDTLTNSISPFVDYQKSGARQPKSVPTMRYLRWSADLNLIDANPTGVGLGQYERHIANYYGLLNIPDARTDSRELFNLETMEPGSFNGYHILTAETGLCGLLAWIFMLAWSLRSGLSNTSFSRRSGLIGFILVLVTGMLWTFPLVRGVGPLIGVFIASALERDWEDF